jgi:hypothetical protein
VLRHGARSEFGIPGGRIQKDIFAWYCRIAHTAGREG